MQRIGFVGTGNIAAPIARVLASRDFPIMVSRRNERVSAELARSIPSITVAETQEVVDGADVIFLCLRAPVAREVLPNLSFASAAPVISVMAGLPLAELVELCAPARDLTLLIPLPFIESGGCPLPVYPESSLLVELFEPDNAVIPVATEEAFQQHFAAATAAPITIRTLREVADWLGERSGGPNAAEVYVVTLVAGYLCQIGTDGNGRLSESLDEMVTAGGLSSQIVTQLDDAGAFAALHDGLDRLQHRLSGN